MEERPSERPTDTQFTPPTAYLTLTGSTSTIVTANNAIKASITRLSETDPKNVQKIAVEQLTQLNAYHQIVLEQSGRSFSVALVGSVIGLAFFAAAVVISLWKGAPAASIPLLSGAVVEGISGLVFYLYGRTSAQFNVFHSRLDTLQRYLIANSICESLDGDDRTKARIALIQEISRPQAVARSRDD